LAIAFAALARASVDEAPFVRGDRRQDGEHELAVRGGRVEHRSPSDLKLAPAFRMSPMRFSRSCVSGDPEDQFDVMVSNFVQRRIRQ
jgi:hypothetical protein